MFHVTTASLSPDGRAANPTFGTLDQGQLSATELVALLESLRRVDPVQNHHAAPEIVVVGRGGRFIIRTGQGKLFLHDARQPVDAYTELEVAGIISQMERGDSAAPSALPEISRLAPSTRPPHRAIAVAILLGGLALNAYTLHSVFHVDSVHDKPAVSVITDAAELTRRGPEVVGSFATGDQTGDRILRVTAEGGITFSELGPTIGQPSDTDAYRLARRSTKICLATRRSGIVDVLNIDTMVYYGDTYRRK